MQCSWCSCQYTGITVPAAIAAADEGAAYRLADELLTRFVTACQAGGEGEE